jgi:mRNA-degrading endonuclease RelE of RelBE toxin-antitoxin system
MPDAWAIEIHAPARRDLGRLPRKVADAALRFIDGPLRENPGKVTKSLEKDLAGLSSGRVGSSYRILVRIDAGTKTVHVYRIAHRADIYRGL